MPRRARLSLPGIPWHIIQRGNNRSACFYTDEDYRRYLDTLKEQADTFGRTLIGQVRWLVNAEATRIKNDRRNTK